MKEGRPRGAAVTNTVKAEKRGRGVGEVSVTEVWSERVGRPSAVIPQALYECIVNNVSGAGETAQWAECSLCKPETLVQIPSTCIKHGVTTLAVRLVLRDSSDGDNWNPRLTDQSA